MAQLNYTADTNMTNSYDLLPKGKYLAMVIFSEIKLNKARTGDLLKLTFEVIDGAGKGRKVFESLNIRHTNKVAEKIGTEQLNALCLATGVLNLTDSEQLHNIPVVIDVVIEAGKDGYDDQNRVKAYSPANAGATQAPARAAAPAASAPAAAPAAAGTPVWKKKAA